MKQEKANELEAGESQRGMGVLSTFVLISGCIKLVIIKTKSFIRNDACNRYCYYIHEKTGRNEPGEKLPR